MSKRRWWRKETPPETTDETSDAEAPASALEETDVPSEKPKPVQVNDQADAPKPDCTELRSEWRRLEEEVAEAELDAEQAQASADNAAAACRRARERVADLKAELTGLPQLDDEEPDQHAAEVQNHLREAQAEVEIVCELVEPARAEAEASVNRVSQARSDAAVARKAFEDCEATGS